jgi:phosphate transport system permease protein
MKFSFVPPFLIQQSAGTHESWAERLVHGLFAIAAMVPTVVALLTVGILVRESIAFFQEVSLWQFLADTQWTPLFSSQRYGIMVLVTATLLIGAIALCVAIPLGTLAAIYLAEYAREPWRQILTSTLETLSGIPTIVFGYFAISFITPALRNIIPSISAFNALSAGIATGILVTPIISSVCEDTLRTIPNSLRQGGYTLGFTKREVIQHILLPAALPGLLASYTLAASRTLGETMIAAIAGGQRPHLTLNPFVPIETITAYIIQVSLGDVPSGTLRFHTIFATGMVLFLMTLTLNAFGRWLLHRYHKSIGQLTIPVVDINQATKTDAIAPDFTYIPVSLKYNPRRLWLDRVAAAMGIFSVSIGLLTLVLMGVVAFRSGFGQLSWSFLSSLPSRRPEEAGIYAALVGTVMLMGLTALISMPIGIGAAIYLQEYLPDRTISRMLDVLIANMSAVPSIIYGLMGLYLFVRQAQTLTGGRSLISASLVMAVVALPLIIITTRNALRSVPSHLRQASYSVGMSRLQMLRHVLLPIAFPGIITGTVLALSRVAGEAAALISIGASAFVSISPSLSLNGLQGSFSTLPTQIFFWAARPQAEFQSNAAAAILVLAGLVLLMNLIAVFIRDYVRRQVP